MGLFDQGTWKPGDEITAARLNAIEDELKRLVGVRGGAGLAVRHSKGGLQVTGLDPGGRYVGEATTAFTPRSGATPGHGSAKVQWRDPATGDLADVGITLDDVATASATTMTSGHSIDSGQKVALWTDPFGTWWASPEECS